MEIDFEEIKALLPHRFPFLMVDRVLSIEKGHKAVAIKNITGNEIFFLGHFPNIAVMPGAFIIESMAQTAIIFFRKSYEDSIPAGQDQNFVFIFGAAKARFLKPVVPGDQLQIEVTVQKAVSTGAVVRAVASVEQTVVAKAELTFGIKRVSDIKK
jgi:3-hydroxyacyl-[acyl-carrier-protein] dehydratase